MLDVHQIKIRQGRERGDYRGRNGNGIQRVPDKGTGEYLTSGLLRVKIRISSHGTFAGAITHAGVYL